MKRFLLNIVLLIYKNLRVQFYSFLSESKVSGLKIQPVMAKGTGKINVADNVHFGVERSPLFFSSYAYIDARSKSSEINIGKNTYINNNACIISDGCAIKIGENCLFGINLQIMNSNFHDLDPESRFGGTNVLKSDVVINDNVFLGNNVTVLKGVTIGENSVVANGSIVSSSIPANVIAAGIPAKVIRNL